MLRETIQKQVTVGFHDPARAFAKKIQVLEGGDAEKLAWEDRRSTKKVIQAAHLPSEIRLRQDPSASQTADTVHLGQAAGHDELGSEVKRRARRFLVHSIKINFIDQDKRADAACDIADLAQNRFRRKRARRIMKIRDQDEARLWRDVSANFRRLDRPTIFFGAAKAFYIRLQVLCDIENGPVRRMLD